MKRLLVVVLLLAPLAKADSLDRFTFAPGEIGTKETSFTISSSDIITATNGLGPIFTVKIKGAPWTFALNEPWDSYAEESFYMSWFSPGALTVDQVQAQFGSGSAVAYICDTVGMYQQDGCGVTPMPWGGTNFIPGSYAGYTITDPPRVESRLSITTPEPSTALLVGIPILLMGLAMLVKRQW
jgi:hypothetical protein